MAAVFILLMLVVLGGVFFWFAGGPRYAVEEFLAGRLRQPVYLAANPGWHWGKQELRIVLPGLRLGPTDLPLFSANRITVALPWRALLHGRVQLQRIELDTPVLNAPWTGAANASGAALSLPGRVVVRDGTLRWSGVAGHTLSLTAVHGQVLADGPSRLVGDWHWRDKTGRWHFAAGMTSAPTLQARRISLLVGTARDPALLQVGIPTLQSVSGELVLPTMHARWQEQKQGSARLDVQALHLNMAQGRLAMQQGALTVGNDLSLQIRAVALNWKKLQGHLAYQVAIRHLPRIAARCGLSLPKLTDPGALQRLTSTGAIRLDSPHFQWTVAQGDLDSSAWKGKISGTWKPLAIQVHLSVAQLDLGHYLPAPRPGKAVVLPALPQQWPVTGEVRIAQLRWGKFSAQNLVIRSAASAVQP